MEWLDKSDNKMILRVLRWYLREKDGFKSDWHKIQPKMREQNPKYVSWTFDLLFSLFTMEEEWWSGGVHVAAAAQWEREKIGGG